MVDILGTVLTDGLEAVEATCAKALSHDVHSAGVVLNILAATSDDHTPGCAAAELRACRQLRSI